MHLLAISDKKERQKNHNTTHDSVYGKNTATVNRALRITSCYGMTLRMDL